MSVWSDYFCPSSPSSRTRCVRCRVGVQFFQGELTTSYGPLVYYLIEGLPLLILFAALAKNFLATASRVVWRWTADHSHHGTTLS